MKKTLLVTLEYPPTIGGVGNYYHRLVSHLPKEDVIVLDNARNQLLNPWLKSFFTIWSYVRKYSIEYIIVGQVLPLGTVVAALSYIMRRPYAVVIHGMDITVPQQYPRKRMLLRWILKRAATIVTVSEFTKSKIQTLLPVSEHHKIRIISPGPYITPAELHTAGVSSEFMERIPGHFFLSVGRLVERKGFDQVIRALAQLPEEYRYYHYVIAGSGPYQSTLERLVQEHDLIGQVHFFPGLSNVEIAELYQRCVCFVMPSRIVNETDFEGFGIVVLEANSFGKVAIGGNSAGMADAILHNKTGLLVNPDNVETLTAAMLQLCSQPDHTEQMGLQAAQWVRTEHDWRVKAEQLAAVCS